MSVGIYIYRAFCRQRATELKPGSSGRIWVCGVNRSEFIAECRFVPRRSVEMLHSWCCCYTSCTYTNLSANCAIFVYNEVHNNFSCLSLLIQKVCICVNAVPQWCEQQACCRSCTRKSQCLDADVDNRWLSYDAWECIRVPPQFVNPARIAITSSVQVWGFQCCITTFLLCCSLWLNKLYLSPY